MTATAAHTSWLQHLIRANGRHRRARGDHYAAAITYFTVLSIFPLLMVAYWGIGIALAQHQDWLSSAHRVIVEHIPGGLSHQVGDLLDRAVKARTAVGVIGLIVGAYSGLNWVATMRAALTEIWEQRRDDATWWRGRLSDLGRLVGLLLVGVFSLGLTMLSSAQFDTWVLRRLRLNETGVAPVLVAVGGIVLSLLSSWAMFTYIIARLPSKPMRPRKALHAAGLAAVVFEVFKRLAGLYMSAVLRSPASAVFGPIVGIMVSAYVTYRIVLFAAAWAATADTEVAE